MAFLCRSIDDSIKICHSQIADIDLRPTETGRDLRAAVALPPSNRIRIELLYS